MSIHLKYVCDGCFTTAEGTATMRRSFKSFSGRNHGHGTIDWRELPSDLAPAHWMASDPYTFCTYCPSCWAEIESEKPTTEAMELTG